MAIFRYNTSWYLMPVPSQKLILFLMQKSGKDFYLTIGFLLMAKMENFAAVRSIKIAKIIENNLKTFIKLHILFSFLILQCRTLF